MRNLFFVLFFVTSTASASGLEGIFKEVIKSVIQDIPQEGGSQTAGNQEVALPSGDIRENEIDQCRTLLASLPNNNNGLERFQTIFFDGNQAKCKVTNFSFADRDKYFASLIEKRTQICLGILDETPLNKELSENSIDICQKSDVFRARQNERAKKISDIKQEEKKVARELRAKSNAGLIDRYKSTVPAKSNFLLSDVIGPDGSNFGPLIEFIDYVQKDSNSKARYEMSGESLIMRHRMIDPVTKKTDNFIYEFYQHPRQPPGEILLNRIIKEKPSLGGLAREMEEIPAGSIGMVFAVITLPMKMNRK